MVKLSNQNMALHKLTSLSATTLSRLPPTNYRISVASSSKNVVFPSRVQCVASIKKCGEAIIRRSANYQPSLWGFDYVQSLKSEYVGESSARLVKKLKQDVRQMLNTEVDPLHQLELIDDLQRLGISYHFEDEIKRILNSIYNNREKGESLHALALEFRLLRQHGYDISAEIFNNFRDEKGNFKSCLKDDCKAILSLYEAAFVLKEAESLIFHDVRNFTTSYLKAFPKENKLDQYLSILVNHALELPLNWRMLRLEARWFIDVYGTRPDMNNILHELAKLDFNMVQATHQEDLKYASRWWKKTGLGEKLSFARDRLMVNFLWTMGYIFEPKFGYCRRMSTKVNAFITTIDDVYDVYGTLDELELFTHAVDRWDVSATEQLPKYMKICFLALHNSINKMAVDALIAHEIDIIPYLKKAWADICKSYLLEAKWFHSGHIPTLEEYIENAWVSISAPVMLVHAYFFITNPITKGALDRLEEYSNIIRWSSMILRLADDLGTSSEELKSGNNVKSIQCYMHETGASEEDAREHIQEMITITWLKINKDRLENPHSLNTIFIQIAMNLAKMAQCMYQYGDGHAIQDRETKDRVLSLLVDPVPFINGDHK